MASSFLLKVLWDFLGAQINERARPAVGATSLAPGMAPRWHRRRSAPVPAGLRCAWPCSDFGIPAAGTYRLMPQDFLAPPGSHNSEDRLLRRHPNPHAIVRRFGG